MNRRLTDGLGAAAGQSTCLFGAVVRPAPN